MCLILLSMWQMCNMHVAVMQHEPRKLIEYLKKIKNFTSYTIIIQNVPAMIMERINITKFILIMFAFRDFRG